MAMVPPIFGTYVAGLDTMNHVIKTAYLRIYQPVESFDEAERAQWFDEAADGDQRETKASTTWLLSSNLPDTPPLLGGPQGAFVRASGERILVCPWRTRLRMLAGLLAFRSSIPEEIAEAFVPEATARLAARELATLDEEHPGVRSHILHANWHVPLRWFAAFDDAERILTEDKDGLRIRYETKLADARVRLERTLSVLENNWIDDTVTGAIRELLEWLEDFDGDGLMELDYASVASMFPDEELVDDHSAQEVTACIDALEAEDLVRAGRLFGSLTDRWTEVRAREVVN
jgi:hypothetical protein